MMTGFHHYGSSLKKHQMPVKCCYVAVAKSHALLGVNVYKMGFSAQTFVLVWDHAQTELNPFVPSVLYVGHLLKPKLLFALLFFFM